MRIAVVGFCDMKKTSIKALLSRSVPVEQIYPSWVAHTDIQLDILRLDQLHPHISGNKWFKLKNHLLGAEKRNITTVLSFGGAWSNHIHALAAAGNALGIKTIGVIRGERPARPSAMLQDVEQWGMQLHFISRKDYRLKHDADFQKQLLTDLSLCSEQVLIVPEGGSGALGVAGCEDILAAGNINAQNYDEIWLACGTGATLAGIVRSTPSTTQVKGVAVLKGADFLNEDIRQHLRADCSNWYLETDYHCGGYGKTTPELLAFIKSFEAEAGIPLDHVYTGKMMLVLKQQILAGQIRKGNRILAVHTGGLQGKRGLIG